METVTDFIFLGSKITADGKCSHEIKRCLLLGRKSMINLKSRDITLPTKVQIVKAMVFLVFLHRCESWTIKKAEHQRIDTFKLWRLWCRRRLLSPFNSKEIKPINPKGNQPWIFIGRTDAEVPIFCQTDAKSQLVGKDCDVGKEWGQEEKGKLRMRWLDGISFEQTPGVS